jgi:hypothetical protein
MVTTIGLVGHVAGLIGQHHWNTQSEARFGGLRSRLGASGFQMVVGNTSHCRRLGQDFEALAQGQIFTFGLGLRLLSIPLPSGFLFKVSRSSSASCKA